MGVSFNAVFHVPEPVSADCSLMTWYSTIIAKGVAPGDQFAIAGLLVVVHAVRIPRLLDASDMCWVFLKVPVAKIY